MGNPVNWFQIQGQDMKSLQSFYKKVFEWKMQAAPDGSPCAMVSPETGGIAGGIGATMDGAANNVAVYVGVDNIKGHLKKIEKAGGRKAMDVMELPQGMGFIAGFVDPAGNWIGLWQPGKNGAQEKPARAKAKTAARPAAKTAGKTAKAAPKGKAKRAAKRGGRAAKRG